MGATVYTGDVDALPGTRTVAPYQGDVDPLDKAPPSEELSKAAKYTGAGAVAGLAGYGAMLFGRRFFPGSHILNPTKPGVLKSFLQDLNGAIKTNNSGSSLKKEFSNYMRDTANANRDDISFMDYMAGKDDHVDKFLSDTIGASGAKNPIRDATLKKASGSQDRLLGALSDALGVKDQTLPQTMDELIAAKKTNAAPLYEKAFADKRPFADPAMRDWMNQYPDQMAAAIAHVNKSQRLKLNPNDKLASDISYAADPSRKDWWKWTVRPEDVPEQFKSGDQRNGLQAYIDPSMQNLHNMKRAIWSLAQDHGRQGLDDASDLKKLYHDFSNKLYELGPPEYKQATDAFRGDVEMQNAAEVGANLLKMKPGDAQAALKDMQPHERQAAAMGFYGAMKDVDQTKLLRTYVNKPEQYKNQNQVLSYLFPDPVKLNDFTSQLAAEHGIQQSTRVVDLAKPPGDTSSDYLRVSLGPSLMPSVKGIFLDKLMGGTRATTSTSKRASGIGAKFLTEEPELSKSGASISHPLWGDVERYDDILKPVAAGAAAATGAGAAGGLGAYGLEYGASAPTGGLTQFQPQGPTPDNPLPYPGM